MQCGYRKNSWLMEQSILKWYAYRKDDRWMSRAWLEKSESGGTPKKRANEVKVLDEQREFSGVKGKLRECDNVWEKGGQNRKIINMLGV